MRVVHRQDQGPVGGQNPQHVQDPARQEPPFGVRIGVRELLAAMQEDGADGLLACFRKLGEDLLDDPAEQIIECREGER